MFLNLNFMTFHVPLIIFYYLPHLNPLEVTWEIKRKILSISIIF